MRPLSHEPGVLGKLFALIGGTVLLILGLMFSAVILAVAAVIALAVFGIFWWKTRELRKALREHQANVAPGERTFTGDVFEGEAVVVEEYRTGEQASLAEDEPPPRR